MIVEVELLYTGGLLMLAFFYAIFYVLFYGILGGRYLRSYSLEAGTTFLLTLKSWAI